MQRKAFLSIDDILEVKPVTRKRFLLRSQEEFESRQRIIKHHSGNEAQLPCSLGRPTFVSCHSRCCCARSPSVYRKNPYLHQYYFNYGAYASQFYLRSHYNKQPKKRMRASFSHEQVLMLQKVFDTKKYLGTSERTELARKLSMTEQQIKIWFQNRRYKAKKQQKIDDGLMGNDRLDSLFGEEFAEERKHYAEADNNYGSFDDSVDYLNVIQ